MLTVSTRLQSSSAAPPTPEALLDALLRSPRLELYARQTQGVLAAEQAAREQFYESVQEGDKAEFVNGEVIVHSPVKLEHNSVGNKLLKLIDTYVEKHDLGVVGYEQLMVSLTRNDYEPDLCFFGKAKAAAFTHDQMRFPAPDFVVEIVSESTVGTDRGVKFDDYAAHGVREYWIVDPVQEVIEHYVLSGDAYTLELKVHDGTLRSVANPGFEMPVRAAFDGAENARALRAMVVGGE